MHSVSNRDSHLYLTHNNSVHLTTVTYVRCFGLDHRRNAKWLDNTTRLCTFIPNTSTHPLGMTLPRIVWVRLTHLCTSVGRFHSCLHKWGMVSSAACEWGTEQTVNHVVLEFPINYPPCTAQPDGSGWWDNWVAAEHLPQDLCGQAVGWKNWPKWWRMVGDLTKKTPGYIKCPGRKVNLILMW